MKYPGLVHRSINGYSACGISARGILQTGNSLTTIISAVTCIDCIMNKRIGSKH